jgi:uncharacterized protein (TIGR00369 family)
MLQPIMLPAEIHAFWDEHFPQIRSAPAIQVVSVGAGEVLVKLTPDDRHLRPGGTVSGPTLFTLADVAAYAVLLAHVGPIPLMVTTTMTINFLRRPPLGPILGHCRILKLGKRLAVVEVVIRSESGTDLVAHATGTYSIPPVR